MSMETAHQSTPSYRERMVMTSDMYYDMPQVAQTLDSSKKRDYLLELFTYLEKGEQQLPEDLIVGSRNAINYFDRQKMIDVLSIQQNRLAHADTSAEQLERFEQAIGAIERFQKLILNETELSEFITRGDRVKLVAERGTVELLGIRQQRIDGVERGIVHAVASFMQSSGTVGRRGVIMQHQIIAGQPIVIRNNAGAWTTPKIIQPVYL